MILLTTILVEVNETAQKQPKHRKRNVRGTCTNHIIQQSFFLEGDGLVGWPIGRSLRRPAIPQLLDGTHCPLYFSVSPTSDRVRTTF